MRTSTKTIPVRFKPCPKGFSFLRGLSDLNDAKLCAGGNSQTFGRERAGSQQCFSRQGRPTDNQGLRWHGLRVSNINCLLQPVRGSPREPTTLEPCTEGCFLSSAKEPGRHNITMSEYHSAFSSPLKLISHSVKCVHREGRRHYINSRTFRRPRLQLIERTLCPAVTDKLHTSLLHHGLVGALAAPNPNFTTKCRRYWVNTKR